MTHQATTARSRVRPADRPDRQRSGSRPLGRAQLPLQRAGSAAAQVPPPVCLYTPSADPSGMGQHMLDLAESYVERGGVVTVMAWPTAPGERLLERAARAGAVPVATPHPRDPRFGPVVADHLRTHPVEVFHLHVGTGREDFDGARAARAAGVTAVVQTLHLPWMMSQLRKRESFLHSIAEVDRLITVSHGQRETYERIGVPRHLLTTVPNGVRPRTRALGRAEARRALGLSPHQPVVLTVGRLIVMKGQRYLVECLPRLATEVPDVAVVVLGSGHLHDALEAQAAELGVSSSLRLAGHRPDARALLDAADVFALPSLHEGMPLVVMEAMDAALPVVGTDVVGTAEIVQPGITGELVRPRDPAALGEALALLLRDPERRARQGAAGRRRFLERFTRDRMVDRTLEVYAAVRRTGTRSASSGR